MQQKKMVLEAFQRFILIRSNPESLLCAEWLCHISDLLVRQGVYQKFERMVSAMQLPLEKP